MKNGRRADFFCMLLLAFTLSASAIAGQNNSFKEHLVWKDESGSQKASAYQIWAMNQEVLIFTLLIELDSQSRLVLYSKIDAPRGESMLRIEDDASPWWFQYTTLWHTSHSNLNDFLNETSIVTGPRATDPKKVTLKIETEDFNHSESFGPDLESIFDSGAEKRFLESICSKKVQPVSVEDVPQSVRDNILRLDNMGSEIDFRYGVLIDLLACWLDSDGFESKPGSTHLSLERVASEVGLGTMVTPEELEFTSRFKSIDNADPLAGWRPEELYPEE